MKRCFSHETMSNEKARMASNQFSKRAKGFLVYNCCTHTTCFHLSVVACPLLHVSRQEHKGYVLELKPCRKRRLTSIKRKTRFHVCPTKTTSRFSMKTKTHNTNALETNIVCVVRSKKEAHQRFTKKVLCLASTAISGVKSLGMPTTSVQ